MITNEYTRLLEVMAFEVIPDYKPLVMINIEGKYAMSGEVTEPMPKSPPSFNVNITINRRTYNDSGS